MVRAWDSDVVAVVNRRADLLAALETPDCKRDLMEELDVSRSTLDRAVRELETLGLVARDGEYYLTPTGQLVLDLFREFRADLEDVGAAEELLRPLPPDAPMSPALIRGATVEVAEPPTPTRALEPFHGLIEDCDRVRGLSVAVTRPNELLAQFQDRLEDGATFEWVFTPEMSTYLREYHPEEIADLHATGQFDLYVAEGIPYGLGLVTIGDARHTYLTLYDEDNTIKGTIVNDGPAAYDWGERVYRSYRENAHPFEPP